MICLPPEQIRCPPLSAPSTVTNCSASASAAIGTVCSAQCSGTARLFGSALRTCGPDGAWTGAEAFCRCPSAAADGSASYFGLGCAVAVPRLYALTATVAAGAAAATALGRADVAVVAVPSAAAVLNAPAGALTLTLSAYRCASVSTRLARAAAAVAIRRWVVVSMPGSAKAPGRLCVQPSAQGRCAGHAWLCP